MLTRTSASEKKAVVGLGNFKYQDHQYQDQIANIPVFIDFGLMEFGFVSVARVSDMLLVKLVKK